jgi:hypothetical protein
MASAISAIHRLIVAIFSRLKHFVSHFGPLSRIAIQRGNAADIGCLRASGAAGSPLLKTVSIKQIEDFDFPTIIPA